MTNPNDENEGIFLFKEDEEAVKSQLNKKEEKPPDDGGGVRIDPEFLRSLKKRNLGADKKEPSPSTLEKAISEAKPIAEPKPKPVIGIISPLEAFDILSAISAGTTDKDATITKLAMDKVLKGNFEVELFRKSPKDNGTNKAIRDALCWILVLENEYVRLDQPMGGNDLSQIVEQTKSLLSTANIVIKSLDKASEEASKSLNAELIKNIKEIKIRISDSTKKVQAVVSALTEKHAAADVPYQRASTTKKQLPNGKTAIPKTEEKLVAKALKVALALIFSVAVLTGAGFYIKSKFKKGTSQVYDTAQFSKIISLLEARRAGNTFIGIAEPRYWNSLSKDEKKHRLEELYNTIKTDTLHGIIIYDTAKTLLAQSYGSDIRVYK